MTLDTEYIAYKKYSFVLPDCFNNGKYCEKSITFSFNCHVLMANV